jgi:protein CpxP
MLKRKMRSGTRGTIKMTMILLHRRAAAATMLAAAMIFVAAMAGAQPAPTPPAAKPPAAKPTAANYVEARIKSLHDQLKITPAEEPQWNAVAKAMRDSAKTTGALVADRAKNAPTMSALDDLHSYQAIAKAHLDGVNNLVLAFDALYTAMPAAQKKIADLAFSRKPPASTPTQSAN